jgi:hypothetical protein
VANGGNTPVVIAAAPSASAAPAVNIWRRLSDRRLSDKAMLLDVLIGLLPQRGFSTATMWH